jgi:beta-mannosidase
MTDEDIGDPAGRMWHYHTKTNPYLDVLLYDSLQIVTEKLFGPVQDIWRKVAAMGYLQYEWVRLALEAARRSKWYCSGIQFWMYNDCWPSSGWSLVDYYGIPKAGYYAFKRAAKPLIASIEPTQEVFNIWVCNDTLQPVTGRVRLRVQPWQGAHRWQRSLAFTTPPNTAQVVARVLKSDVLNHLGSDSLMVCDLDSAAGSDRAWYYAGLPRHMTLPAVRLEVTRSGHDIIISTDTFARVVTLDGDADFSDNYFDILPGETRRVTTSKSAEDIQVSCWNNDAI